MLDAKGRIMATKAEAAGREQAACADLRVAEARLLAAARRLPGTHATADACERMSQEVERLRHDLGDETNVRTNPRYRNIIEGHTDALNAARERSEARVPREATQAEQSARQSARGMPRRTLHSGMSAADSVDAARRMFEDGE